MYPSFCEKSSDMAMITKKSFDFKIHNERSIKYPICFMYSSNQILIYEIMAQVFKKKQEKKLSIWEHF